MTLTTKRGSTDLPFYSGWCGPGSREEAHQRCPGTIRNGANAPRPWIPCACTCHIEIEAPREKTPRRVVRRPRTAEPVAPQPGRRVVRRSRT